MTRVTGPSATTDVTSTSTQVADENPPDAATDEPNAGAFEYVIVRSSHELSSPSPTSCPTGELDVAHRRSFADVMLPLRPPTVNRRYVSLTGLASTRNVEEDP